MCDQRDSQIFVALALVAAACGCTQPKDQDLRGEAHEDQASHLDTRKGPRLGTPLEEKDIARLDITIFPNGEGLPPGSGDAARGATVFAEQCAVCHGEAGAGGFGAIPRLTGGVGSLSTAKPLKTVGSFWPSAPLVFDYIRRTMPPTAPGSLPADDIYAVTAYLLTANGILQPHAQLDARSLPAVKMPNRNGFRPMWSQSGKELKLRD